MNIYSMKIDRYPRATLNFLHQIHDRCFIFANITFEFKELVYIIICLRAIALLLITTSKIYAKERVESKTIGSARCLDEANS